MSWRRCVPALPALLVAGLVLVPFVNKPFTIDDSVFLLEAKHALRDPLHPSAFAMVWDDEVDRGVPSPSVSVSGPVMAWLLMPAALAGGSEWLAHSIQLLLLAIALFATAALGQRLGLSRAASTTACILVASAPAVLGMAGTAMPDVAAMAFGVAGVERLVAWKQERRGHQAILAAILLGLAIPTRSHLALVLGVGALLVAGDFWTARAWRDVPWRTWIPLLAAPLVAVAVISVTSNPDPGARATLAVPPQLTSLGWIPQNVVSFAAGWFLALPLVVPWTALRFPQVARRWWVIAAGAAGAGAVLYLQRSSQLFIAVVAGVTLGVLVDVFADAWHRRDSVQLSLGAWLLVPLAPATYVHLPPKYLLAAAPAAGLIVARLMARRAGRMPTVLLGTTAALGVVLGVAILRADAAFADVGRRAAKELVAPMAQTGSRVWFVGSWGFYWYAVNAGARPVTLSAPYPEAGDIVVIGERTNPSASALRVLRRYPRASFLGRIEDTRPGGRVMSQALGAGFFSNMSGYLPWAWGNDLLDRVEMWKLEAPMAASP